MEQAQTYKFSKGIHRAKERFRILAILFPAMLIAYLFLSPTMRAESLAFKAGLGLIMLVVLGLVFYLSSSRALRRLSELSVSIFPDRLERLGREHRESFLWKDLQHMEVLEYPNGEVASVKLSFADRQAANLFGFEDMEAFLRQMEPAIPRETPIRRKRMRLNWDDPVVIICAALVTLAVIFAIQQIGEKAYRIFNALFFLAFGLFNLVFKPLSSAQGKAWRPWETGLGVLLIGLGLLNLAMELFQE